MHALPPLNQAMTLWSARWVLDRDSVVCKRCLNWQNLADVQLAFEHSSECKGRFDGPAWPWVDLHVILKVQLG